MSSFEDTYRRYCSDVHRFAMRLCADPVEAEDLTSETFVRAWTGRNGFAVETVKGYLLTITRNLYLKQRARDSRLEMQGEAEPADRQASPSSRLEAREEYQRVDKALRALPEIDRSALLLRAEHGLPYAEIARVLGISLSSAKVKVHRARIQLAAVRQPGASP